MELFRTIRGVEIIFHAEHFIEDPDVGINLHPEETWATTIEGQPFELTEEEDYELSCEAINAFYEDL